MNELDSGVNYKVYVEGYVAGNWLKIVKDQVITTGYKICYSAILTMNNNIILILFLQI